MAMPTKSITMAAEDDEVSLSSNASSSSEESEASSAAESLKDHIEDPRDACYRQSACVGIAAMGCIVIFSVFILMLSQDNAYFELSVSACFR